MEPLIHNPAWENRAGIFYRGGFITDETYPLKLLPECKPLPSVNGAELWQDLLALEWDTKRTARQEYFMSDRPMKYSYGNRGTGDETYDSKQFTYPTRRLRDMLNVMLGIELNVCFLNKYDDEKNHLGWHADEFPGMREDQPIVVVSLGAEREIWVKPKGESGIVPPEQRIRLGHGSLFVMPPGYQATHLHRIPKHDRPCGPRISLTFRAFV